MHIFVSWSGERSRAIAQALRDWLPYIFPSAQPWMSAADLDRGARWSLEISEQLDKTHVGIICLTPENVGAPWILYEAGALSKALSRALVCTYLFQLRPADLKGPLVQFQASLANEHDTKKLVFSLNRALGIEALPDERLNKVFSVWWPELQGKLAALSAAKPESVIPQRTERDILEEILSLQRRNDLRAMAPELAELLLDSMWSREKNQRPGNPGKRPIRTTELPRNKGLTLAIDTSALVGPSGRRIHFTYTQFGCVSDFLDELFGHLSDSVPPATYGVKWALREVKTGKQFAKMGRTWASSHLEGGRDTRSLESVGIMPGMRLETIPLPG